MTASRQIRGILFDKDGTLFDFGGTWNVWAGGVLADLARGDADRLAALADAAGYDLTTRAFLPHSPIIAETNRAVAECLAQALPGVDIDALERHLMETAATAPLVPAVPLGPLLDGLLAMDLRLGVMTNDTESGARAHLGTAGVAARFHFIAGFDSGHGAKPSAQPLLAFATSQGLDPRDVAMVGDSTHDLQAGRAAGMVCVGVLSGPASRATLAPLADVVLPDIGHLPGWLMARATPG